MSELLPSEVEFENWQPSGSPENYEGDDLFFLINGGADIYYEYGFKEVIAEHYMDDENNSIRVEIYKMKDPGAAYGIYSVSESPDAEAFKIGYHGEMSDYHIRFWKDNYYILVSAMDSGEEIEDGMKKIASFIDGKIPQKGEKPEIVNHLPEENFISAKYVRGNLGMNNVYSFTFQDIFGYNEAIAGDYSHFKLFIMAYDSKENSSENLEKAGESMKDLDKFSGYEPHERGFSFTDNEGNNLFFSLFNNYILLFIGEDLTYQPEMFELIEDSLE